MITLPKDEALFVPHHSLQKMLHNPELIKMLARQLVAAQVEAHIDMAHDCGSEYPSHAEAAAVIKDAKTTVEDYFEELVMEFRDSVYEAIRSVEIDVKSTTFSAEGFEDAEVEVK
jgi:hypothetical protein